MFQIESNLKKIRENIRAAAEKTGRSFEEIEIVAVTKGRSPEEIKEVLNCGLKKIGENRVQAAGEKLAELKNLCEWHLIGHLQTNKVKPAVELFELIHSVDSLKLVREISARASQAQKIQKILIQVNTSGETTKFGLRPEESLEFIGEASQFKNIAIQGFMTLAPFSTNPEDSRPFFRKLKEIFEKIKTMSLPNVEMKWLSMGMSQDYTVAVEEGANLLRIGTAIFN